MEANDIRIPRRVVVSGAPAQQELPRTAAAPAAISNGTDRQPSFEEALETAARHRRPRDLTKVGRWGGRQQLIDKIAAKIANYQVGDGFDMTVSTSQTAMIREAFQSRGFKVSSETLQKYPNGWRTLTFRREADDYTPRFIPGRGKR